MEKIIFTCKTVTPLVMNGAYGDIPELRPPGIKASLRFWWRALHGHLTLDQLREEEAKIFGSTKGRSKVLIRVEEPIENKINKDAIKNAYLLPHKANKREKSSVSAFVSDLIFKIRLDCEPAKREMINNLFIFICTVGGWGKRSRRGFGSVEIIAVDNQQFHTPMELNGIHSIIEKIVQDRFSNTSSEIITKHNTLSSKGEYPEIHKIQIGKNIKTLKDIGQATHDTKFSDDSSYNKQDYGKSLGDGRHRLASPVFVSILPNGFAVVTTLKKEGWVSTDLQDKLKNRILL